MFFKNLQQIIAKTAPVAVAAVKKEQRYYVSKDTNYQ